MSHDPMRCWCPCGCGCDERSTDCPLQKNGLCHSCSRGEHEVPPTGVRPSLGELVKAHESILKQYRKVEMSRLAQMSKMDLYRRVMGVSPELNDERGDFLVRLYDGGERIWCDVTGKVSLEAALEKWCECTENGNEHTNIKDFDYYRIFPYHTVMLFSAS